MKISESKLIWSIVICGLSIFCLLLIIETKGVFLFFLLVGITIAVIRYRMQKPKKLSDPLPNVSPPIIEPAYLRKILWGVLFLPSLAFLLWVLYLLLQILEVTLPPLRISQEGVITKKVCLVDYPQYSPDEDLKQCTSARLYTYYISYEVSGKKYVTFDAPVVAGKGPGSPSKLYTNGSAVGDNILLYIGKNNPENAMLALNLLTEWMAVTFLLTLALILCSATSFHILKVNK